MPDPSSPVPVPPKPLRRPRTRTVHGRTFADPYAWLADEDNPRVIAHLEAENAHTDLVTASAKGLADAIYDEIDARTLQTDLSVADFVTHSGGDAWWYYTRMVEGGSHAIYCRCPATTRDDLPTLDEAVPGEQVLLDGNLEARGHDFFQVTEFAPSPDGTLLAWACDTVGDERDTLRIRNLATGADVETIEDMATATWVGDDHVVYGRQDDANRLDTLVRHRLGTPLDEDTVLWHEADERFRLGAGTSRDNEWLILEAASKTTTETRLLPVATPTGEPWTVTPRATGVEYAIEVAGDRLLVLHNVDAPDFALAEAPIAPSSPAEWAEVIPHTPGTRLLTVDAYATHVVLGLRRDGLPRGHVIARTPSGDLGPGEDLTVAGDLTTVRVDDDDSYTSDRIRVVTESWLQPAEVHDHILATGERRLLKRRVVRPSPTGRPYDLSDYVERRLWTTAGDGTRVPVSVVHRAGLDLPAPALVYAYGAYEVPLDPVFSIARLSLLDRDIVYAVAHVRGGGELGRHWYEDGRLATKQHTFTDLVDAASGLVDAGIAKAGRIAARGFSAGGLTVGAALNLRPDLFTAAHVGVGFVDALTTMLDPTAPLVVSEYDEWGDPTSDVDTYDLMASYTPYENIRAVEYPAILATASLQDTRVSYAEPAKWVAALRYATKGSPDRPVLLRTDMTAGHGGASGRYAAWKDEAFELSWLVERLLQQ